VEDWERNRTEHALLGVNTKNVNTKLEMK